MAEEKKEEEKENVVGAKKKIEEKKAFARGKNLGMSTKHACFICKFIKGKSIDEAINLLEKVMNKKIALPMTGEIPHRKGYAGRYPAKASKIFINLLKSLRANANMAGEARISLAKADKASRPNRRFKGRFKRTHVYLEASELQGSKILDSYQNSKRILKSKDSDSSQKSKKISDTREIEKEGKENGN